MNYYKDWYDKIVIENGILDIPYEKISKGRTRIGFGRYGIVYKTTCDSIEGDVVIKEVYIRSDSNKEYIKNFINEVKIHNLTRNERIIQFHGISRNVKKKLYYIVMEYANDGTLYDFLNKKKSVNLKERICLAIQISEGLSYLHNKLNISHRDLHTKNILVKDGNIKISDFGMSKSFKHANGKNGLLTIFCSPSTLDKVSDVYSLGVILLELSNYRKMFKIKIDLKKDRKKSRMTSNLELKQPEPVYLSVFKKGYICAIDEI